MKPLAYMDAVDSRIVCVAPKRKRWLSEHEDKEWRKFHADNELNTPLFTAEAIEAAVLAEREACAKECDMWAAVEPFSDFSSGSAKGAEHCAAAIRARGNL